MADSGDLYLLCGEVLDAAIDALETIPHDDATLDGAPERTYVSPGQPALDCCPQLTVHADGVTTKQISPEFQGRGIENAHLPLVAIVVTSVRCVPVPDDQGNPPSAEALDDAGKQIDADGWALWNHLYNLWRADLLFTLCGEVFWDGLRPLNPSGGCAGWVLNFRVLMDGYPEVVGS